MNKGKVDFLKKPKIPFKIPEKQPNIIDFNNDSIYPINIICNKNLLKRNNSISTNNSDDELDDVMYIKNEDIEYNYISIEDIIKKLPKKK